MTFGPVFFVLGLLISVLAFAMLIPAAVDLLWGHADWPVFVAASALTLFVGVTLMLSFRGSTAKTLGLRQAFLLTTLSWLVIAIFAAFPFMFSELDMSVTDAFFESMSGITTTGSTVIVGLDGAAPGILLWRALLQWLGGVGIIVMALAVLPILSVGGMQLFQTEAFDAPDKVVPRATQLAGGIGLVYVALTVVWAIALWGAGMPGFDAMAHAMTTLATGGYSTKDASVAHFANPLAEWIIIAGMIVGSLPFVYYLRAVQGHIRGIWRDGQVRWFLWTVALAAAMVTGWVFLKLDLSAETALRQATFNVTSVLTGTGFSTAPFDQWGGFTTTLFLSLMFVGGCAGSTTCGIKIFRFQVLFSTAKVQLDRLLRPHGVFIAYYGDKPIPETVSEAVMGFFYLYMASVAALAALLAWTGVDFVTAVSGAATAICNVGPGLGPNIGPHGTFADLPDAAKWLLAGGMLLGRLEIFTVLVILTPAFWRK